MNQDFFSEQITKLREANDPNPKNLSVTQRRYLNYFWDRKRRKVRPFVPLEFIQFTALEGQHPGAYEAGTNDVFNELLTLKTKGFVKFITLSTGAQQIQLADPGLSYVIANHANVIAAWDSLLERTPKIVSLICAILGLVASVLGIIEYCSK